MSNALAIVTGAIQEARDDFSRVLVDRSISFERESGFAIQILQNNDFAMKIAMSFCSYYTDLADSAIEKALGRCGRCQQSRKILKTCG